MTPQQKLGRWANFFLIAAGFVVVVAGMRAASDILAPFLLALFLAIICAPPLYWLQRIGVPKVVAVTIVIVGFVGVWLGVVSLVGTSVVQLTDQKKVESYQRRFAERTEGVLRWIEDSGGPKREELFAQKLDTGAIVGTATNMAARVGSLLANGFVVVITIIFILLEASSFPVKVRAAFHDAETKLTRFDAIAKSVQRYLIIKTIISLITGIGVTVGLMMMGVDYAILWGVIAFLLNYVPYFGSLIAAIPAMLLAFIQIGPVTALMTGALYLGVNQLMGSLIEPHLMGRGLGLSPLVVLISLLFWGWVLGPVGMLLSVLLTMILKIAAETHEDTRWVAVLLGSGKAAEASLIEYTGESDES